jgi:DNA helicase-2/ATP-dependent DNA helicase PcrA
VIYDREDQEAVLGEVLAKFSGGAEPGALAALRASISDAKNALVTPEEAARKAMTEKSKRAADGYALYQKALRANGALDFDDLIAECVKLFREFPEVGERYGRRFEHVLVDEYQDTNHAQFRLVEALARVHRNLFAVGDDDQSIYGWRGADRSNLLDFERAFPGAAVVRLEQNYRSTGNILKAANAVVANNRKRQEKNLWCEREDGAPIRFVLAADEAEERGASASSCSTACARAGGSTSAPCSTAPTPSRARSRPIYGSRSCPYQIVGGVAFYQRREGEGPGRLPAAWSRTPRTRSRSGACGTRRGAAWATRCARASRHARRSAGSRRSRRCGTWSRRASWRRRRRAAPPG